MSELSLSYPVEYLCVMGLRLLEIFQLFQCVDRLYMSESDVYTRKILT